MIFSKLCQYYRQLENTSKRLEKVVIIKDLLAEAQGEEIGLISYMTTGSLGPDFNQLVLGIKVQTIKSIFVSVTTTNSAGIQESYRKYGDLGDVIYQEFEMGQKQSSLDNWFGDDKTEEYSVTEIWRRLEKIAETSGEASLSKKSDLVSEYLQNMQPYEAKYYIRIILGKIRLGTNTPTFLEAASQLVNFENSRDVFDKAYYMSSDIGVVIQAGITKGKSGLDQYISPTPGVPIKCMAAERERDSQAILERLGGKCAVEDKYDGYRVQIHTYQGQVKLYSRNQEDYTDQFPDITEKVLEVTNGKDAIFEGEIIAYDYHIDKPLPFQTLTVRSRKYNIQEKREEIPVKVLVFDILYYDGQSFISEPFPIRRSVLEKYINEVEKISLAEIQYCSSAEQLDDLLLSSKDRNCEGIMVKDIRETSYYQAGGRGYGWIKYKADYIEKLTDTFDLAVVGAYYGRGKRSGTYGTLLVAAWNESRQNLQSFCKVGSGLTDDLLQSMKSMLDPKIIPKSDPIVEAKEKTDVWFEPEIIIEIAGTEITRSPVHSVPYKEDYLSLRFPRFQRLREDKQGNMEMCTTVKEIQRIYEQQQG